MNARQNFRNLFTCHMVSLPPADSTAYASPSRSSPPIPLYAFSPIAVRIPQFLMNDCRPDVKKSVMTKPSAFISASESHYKLRQLGIFLFS